MSCSNGVCAPTETDAVLNVDDLETLLASGNIKVTTTGSVVQAKDINVTTALTWNDGSTLALDAHHEIAIAATISVAGSGGMSLVSGSGAQISYEGGNIAFANLESSLTINKKTFLLVADIKTLSNDVASQPHGNFALANNYDASADGTYASDPVETPFDGIFEGLGNAISNLSISDGTDNEAGLFETISSGGILRDVGVVNASISSVPEFAGVLVGLNKGKIIRCYSSGTVNGGAEAYAGGLIGSNEGLVIQSSTSAVVSSEWAGGLVGSNNGTIHAGYATGAVTGTDLAGGLVAANEGGVIYYSQASGTILLNDTAEGSAGGLAGIDFGLIAQSFATGSVTGGSNVVAGGLAGEEVGTLEDSYATGDVGASNISSVGGLVGCVNGCESSTGGEVLTSYSTGRVARSAGGFTGGFVGTDNTFGGITNSYWDTTTSGRRKGTGNRGNEPGITGRTTTQLQSKLPYGFSKKVWAENPGINGGLPYLIANPPN